MRQIERLSKVSRVERKLRQKVESVVKWTPEQVIWKNNEPRLASL